LEPPPHPSRFRELRFDLKELKDWMDRNTMPVSGPPLSPEELATLKLGS
jgi:hypothetical protein